MVTNMKLGFTMCRLDIIQLMLFKNGQDLKGSSQPNYHISHKYFFMDLK